jgi:hypothetical protein
MFSHLEQISVSGLDNNRGGTIGLKSALINEVQSNLVSRISAMMPMESVNLNQHEILEEKIDLYRSIAEKILQGQN